MLSQNYRLANVKKQKVHVFRKLNTHFWN